MPRQLPQELVDYIIDQVSLANDIVTLKHATLTCKSWLPRSSQHLFQTPNVTTTNLSDLEALAATLKESDRLARYISCVTFGLHEEAAVSIQLSLSLMGDVLSRLPHLSEVVVSGMHDSADKELALCPRSALLHPITEKPLPRLTLFFAYAPLTNAVLSLFPSVHTLQVTEWPNGQYPASATTEHRVTELIIRQPQNTASLADLAKLINPPTLARLVVDFRDDLPWSAPPVALEELIRALGAQLTALEIHHCDTGMTDTTCSIPALATCTNLQTATFSAPVLLPAHPDDLIEWTQILLMLPHVPPALPRLKFVVDMFVSEPSASLAGDIAHAVQILDWRRVRAGLRHAQREMQVEIVLRLEALADGVVVVKPEAWQDEVREVLRRELTPRRGTVTFESEI